MVRFGKQLRWLTSVRLIIVSSLLVPYVLQRLIGEEPLPGSRIVFLIAGVTYLMTGLFLAVRWLRPESKALHTYLQFGGDLLIVTALVYRLGGVSSPFSILYLVVIIVACTYLKRSGGLMVAGICWVIYAAVVTGLHLGWIPPWPGWPFDRSTAGIVAYYLALHLFAFFSVALVTSHLSQRAQQAQDELQEKSDYIAELEVVYRDIIESVPSGLITTDRDGLVTSCNRAGGVILERNEQELAGQPIEVTGLFDRDEWLEVTATQEGPYRKRDEVKIETPSGRRFAGFTLTPMTNASGEGTGFIVIFQDLTEYKKMRDVLQLQDRMAAIGRLGAGIAHELGNPLAAITGSVQMLSSSAEPGSHQSKLIDIILKESQRLDRTVKSFLRFARPGERASKPFDVARLLTENLELLSNSSEVLPSHELDIELDPPSAIVVADPDQISQIFWNLARNSLRAMPDGGSLKVEGRLNGNTYRMIVTDSGRGMTDEEQANLFHPFQSFFDTGTGIGMSIVYRIVEEHDGKVYVDSEPNRGTRITVEFPAISETPNQAVLGV